MTNRSLHRLTGIALVAASTLVTIGFSLHPHDPIGSNLSLWVVSHILIFGGFNVGLLGLVGLYAVVASRTRVVALIGFALASVSLALYLGKVYWSGFIYPLALAQHPEFISNNGFSPGEIPLDRLVRTVFNLGPILFGIGYGMLGTAMLKVRAFPATPLWLMIAGGLLVGCWPLMPDRVQHLSVAISLVFSIGSVWLGVLLIGARPNNLIEQPV